MQYDYTGWGCPVLGSPGIFTDSIVLEKGLFSMNCFETKYCERCGTLRLRQEGSKQVYCKDCARVMARVFLAPSEFRPEGKKACASERQIGGGVQ